MAALTATSPTLLDFRNALDPNDRIALMIEMLSQTNEIIEDIPFLEGNLLTGHQTTVRTGLPTPTWRKLYGGVQPGKSTSVPVVDNCGELAAYSEVDAKLVELNGNSGAWRLSEDRAHIEGMNQEFAGTLMYGNEGSEPEAFTGIAPRMNSLSAENADHVIDAGGTTNLTSIYLCVWGDQTGHGIYPKGSTAGFQIEDKGKLTTENIDGSQGRAEIYRTRYGWDLGFTMRDWRYFARVANIDTAALTLDAATGAKLIDLMTQLLEIVQDLKLGSPRFYLNRKIRGFLRRQIANKVASSTLTMDTVAGKRVMQFEEVPVRRVDQILNTESRVV